LMGREGVERLRRLAERLGASVGGSREAVDRGWLPFTQQIGQTGRTIAPRCLVALGISGATQFLSGVKDAESVVAVNHDLKAPIFNYADLKVLGDLHQVVDALIDCLEPPRPPGTGASGG